MSRMVHSSVLLRPESFELARRMSTEGDPLCLSKTATQSEVIRRAVEIGLVELRWQHSPGLRFIDEVAQELGLSRKEAMQRIKANKDKLIALARGHAPGEKLSARDENRLALFVEAHRAAGKKGSDAEIRQMALASLKQSDERQALRARRKGKK